MARTTTLANEIINNLYDKYAENVYEYAQKRQRGIGVREVFNIKNILLNSLLWNMDYPIFTPQERDLIIDDLIWNIN